jgi:hypothetical protein
VDEPKQMDFAKVEKRVRNSVPLEVELRELCGMLSLDMHSLTVARTFP